MKKIKKNHEKSLHKLSKVINDNLKSSADFILCIKHNEAIFININQGQGIEISLVQGGPGDVKIRRYIVFSNISVFSRTEPLNPREPG